MAASPFLFAVVLLASGASAGLLKLLDVPSHDGTNRVCQLTTKAALEEAITTTPLLVVRVVEDMGQADTSCLSQDYMQVAAQLLVQRQVKFCNISADPLKEHHPGLAAAAGNVYFYRSGQQFPYHGRRSAETLYGAIRQAMESHVSVISGRLDKIAFDQLQQTKVAGFFMKGSPEYTAFEDASVVLGPSVPFYAVFDRTVAKHLKLNLVGQVAVYQPFMKQPVVCPTNPASLTDLLMFLNQHKRPGMTVLNDYNLHDPQLADYSRINLLAIGEMSTTKGLHLHHLLKRIIRNQTTVDLSAFNIVWIDPVSFPIVHAVMDQHGLSGELPVFGTYNKTTGKKIWFDMRKLNMTGDKAAEESNVKLILDWMQLLATGGAVPGRRWFTVTPSSQTVNEGSDVLLECTVEDALGDCLWLKDGQNIGFNLERLPHLAWRGDHLNGDCSLIVHGAHKGRDDGSWVCEITGDAERSTITSPPAHLTVEDASQQKEEF